MIILINAEKELDKIQHLFMTKNSQIFLEQQVNLTMRAKTMTIALVLWEEDHQ